MAEAIAAASRMSSTAVDLKAASAWAQAKWIRNR
jgi:hypothetical protein